MIPYSILFIRKSKREGNFCTLDLKFSTFWWWWEQKENISLRAAVKLSCIHTYGNNKQAVLAVELLSKQSTSRPLHNIKPSADILPNGILSLYTVMYTSRLFNYVRLFWTGHYRRVKFAALLEQIHSGFLNRLDFTGFQMRHREWL